MERDFMGLNSKEPFVEVKEGMNNDCGCKNSGFTKGGMVKWPFMNKVPVHPHLMSLNTPQIRSDDSTAFRLKSVNHDGQGGGIHFSLTPYPALHDVNYMNRPHNVKMFPSLKSPFATVAQNMNASGMKQPLLGGIPVTAPHSCVKPCVSTPKLTIFYAGTVNVFDDITPEKAKAIMLMARNGISVASNVTVPNNVEAARHSKPIPLSSPLSVSSHSGAKSGSVSSSSDEFLTPKTFVNKADTPKAVNTNTMLPSAVPQARKASLARFLEKRKERVLSAAPYNLNKKCENMSEESASEGADAV
ncbi:protein TIFY 6A-like isoform X2 [Vigna unguiculata]|uniref:protein TIFY 6A-like isoform X2 n=1 Tax=Vigna unguiculata TaxID=3917 RepID=UPI0010162A27|nr:protein TIFY 6A-like isoform X2 [Vigna unguiculata]